MLKENNFFLELFHMIKERFKTKWNYANFSKMERLGKKSISVTSSLPVTCLLYQLQSVCLEAMFPRVAQCLKFSVFLWVFADLIYYDVWSLIFYVTYWNKFSGDRVHLRS